MSDRYALIPPLLALIAAHVQLGMTRALEWQLMSLGAARHWMCTAAR
jgi:hypothetical protein